MTEMHEPDADTTLDDRPLAVDLAAEAGDERIRSLLGQARTAWFSTAETQPTDELRAFLSGATRPAPSGSPRAWNRWSTSVMDTLSNLWPPSGRIAFGASLAALASVVIAAGFALAAPDTEQTGAASSGSTPTSMTVVTTPTTSTDTGDSSTPMADQPATRITVADAGTADIAVVDGVPVLVAADPAPGWRIVEEIPDEPNEIDLSYRRGDERVDLDVEIEDGEIRVRVRDRRTGTRTETFLGSPTRTSDRHSDDDDHLDDDGTADSVDDGDHAGDQDEDTSRSDDDRRDESGSGSDDDDRNDNSGPGNADDRGDSSGSGSGDGDGEGGHHGSDSTSSDGYEVEAE